METLGPIVNGGTINLTEDQQTLYGAIAARREKMNDLRYCSNLMEPNPPQNYTDETNWIHEQPA